MDPQQQVPASGGTALTVPAVSDTEVFARWRTDMRAYADKLLGDADMMEETATQSRARAAMSRQIGADLHKVIDAFELPRRTPGAALHETLIDPKSVFERVHPSAS